ncbi:ribonucleotide-diphosphate reductase subunit beta [Candidatus Gracilibacteria bacterium]|nr:MAG: ribonucleotide-diphosphate reductase subunit beta [Candidatus Gracilibacteria bacterium]PIE85336.1 MAG: ribonucleotide-diphosphate reductase subunit beta [Candidatus Gracilibacteria bacterium]
MAPNKIFNPEGNDNVSERRIIKGNTTGLFQLNSTKYNWAKSLYQVMIGNFWVPEKVKGLGEDAIQFRNELKDDEKRAYKGILSFLIFLDSVQTVNLPNFSDFITAPEVNLILSIQTYQEAIHSQSYATILETIVDSQERDEIYYFWKNDKHLLERNEFIGGIYQDFVDDPNEKNFFKGIIGNYLLESVYFYNGFAFFDTLAIQSKMVATDRMINYIRRDELTHVTIFANIIKEIRKEFPEIYDEKLIYEMMEIAIKQEIKWSKHILGNSIIGMGHKNVEQYTKWLANERLNLLGLKPLYKDVVDNPYKHLEVMQDNNSERGNFFESTVTNYAQSNSMNGSWDF